MKNNTTRKRIFLLILAAVFISFNIVSAQTANFESATNKAIATSYIIKVVNNKDLSLITNIYSSEYVFHGMDGIKRHTIKDSSLISFLNYLFKAFPDLNYSIDNVVAEGDMVGLNLTGKATHKGEFLGCPASNKKIEFKEMFFFRILNGKITEGWGVVDLDGVKGQISRQ